MRPDVWDAGYEGRAHLPIGEVHVCSCMYTCVSLCIVMYVLICSCIVYGGICCACLRACASAYGRRTAFSLHRPGLVGEHCCFKSLPQRPSHWHSPQGRSAHSPLPAVSPDSECPFSLQHCEQVTRSQWVCMWGGVLWVRLVCQPATTLATSHFYPPPQVVSIALHSSVSLSIF